MAKRKTSRSSDQEDAATPAGDAASHAAATADPPPRALVWCDPGQGDLLALTLRRARVETALVASPRGGAAREIASGLGAEPADDLRQAVLAEGIGLIVLASVASPDAAELLPAEAPGELAPVVVSFSPWPDSLIALRGDRGTRAWPVRFAPVMRRSPGWKATSEVLDAFAPASILGLSFRAAQRHATLAARLCDAMDIALLTLGEPETIDASVRGPRSRAGLHLAPGDSLPDLRGALSAHLRYADGRSAAVTIADNAGHWFRGVTLLGENGCLRIDDAGFEWIDPEGRVVDSARRAETDAAAKGDDALAAILAAEIRGAIESPHEAPALGDVKTTLAMAEAATLSARTGQPESPATIMRMTGAL